MLSSLLSRLVFSCLVFRISSLSLSVSASVCCGGDCCGGGCRCGALLWCVCGVVCENRHHVPMCFNMCAWCWHTRGRSGRTHDDVLDQHHAHMLKHMGAWCRYTRGTCWTDTRGGEEGRGRCQPRVSSVKTSVFAFLEHLNRMFGHLLSHFSAYHEWPTWVITCFTGPPKETLGSFPLFHVNKMFPIPPIIRLA